MDEIKAILDRERNQAYKDGIAEGRQTALRIAIWYQVNPCLSKPHSLETLKEWTDKELALLEAKIK